jgi:hypothetical protein
MERLLTDRARRRRHRKDLPIDQGKDIFRWTTVMGCGALRIRDRFVPDWTRFFSFFASIKRKRHTTYGRDTSHLLQITQPQLSIVKGDYEL